VNFLARLGWKVIGGALKIGNPEPDILTTFAGAVVED